jgi:hypothetical protein
VAKRFALLTKISITAGVGVRGGVRICRAVDDERRDTSDGRGQHRWIERTSESRSGAESDLAALLPLGVEMKLCNGRHSGQFQIFIGQERDELHTSSKAEVVDIDQDIDADMPPFAVEEDA